MNIDQAIKLISESIGKEKVTVFDKDLDTYSFDKTSNLSARPDAVAFPENADDVSQVLKICNDLGVAVTPRGSGTGVTGGALAVEGGIIISLEKMNRILEIDDVNMIATVEPGVITGVLQAEALKHGLIYPPDPASLDDCSIAGNLAANAGGARAVKYGITKDYILGIEFVVPGGDIMRTGGKIVKNAAGYNLTGIMIGSEGTLGIATKIFVKLLPAPVFTFDLLIPFETIEDAVSAVATILKNRIIPSTIEFMEKDAIVLVSEYLGGEILFPEAGAHLLIQIDGNYESAIEEDISQILNVLNISSCFIAKDQSDKNKLWETRRSIRKAIEAKNLVFFAEDCSVPRSEIAAFLNPLKTYLKSCGLKSIMFGHAGDGNVHVNIFKGEMPKQDWITMLPDLKMEIYKRALMLGGSITGEHGIGSLRKNYIGLMMSDVEIELQKRIKKAFDPKGILNPGKVFPDLYK